MQDDAELVQISRSDDVEGFFSGVVIYILAREQRYEVANLPNVTVPTNLTVVTRLHTRYGKHSLGEDLVFREVSPISGGVGMPRGEDCEMAFQGARASNTNRF
jgi:hypothetical protein